MIKFIPSPPLTPTPPTLLAPRRPPPLLPYPLPHPTPSPPACHVLHPFPPAPDPLSEQTLNALLEQLLLPASTSPLARIAQLRAENGYNARLVSTPALLPCAGGRSFAKALTHYRKASRAEFPFVVAALADLFEHVTACVNAAALCDPPLSAKPAPKPKAPPKPRVPPIPSFPSAVKLAVPKPKGVKRLRDDGADPTVPGTSLSYADRVLREEYFENFKKLRSGDQKSQLVPLARGDWDRETVGADSVT